MALVKLKLPPLSNWLVSSRVQPPAGVERFVEPSRTKFAPPTPPVPLKPRPPPEIEIEPMTGVVVRMTEIVPAVFKALVFHARPKGRGGSCTFANEPV